VPGASVFNISTKAKPFNPEKRRDKWRDKRTDQQFETLDEISADFRGDAEGNGEKTLRDPSVLLYCDMKPCMSSGLRSTYNTSQYHYPCSLWPNNLPSDDHQRLAISCSIQSSRSNIQPYISEISFQCYSFRFKNLKIIFIEAYYSI
jgi:hypothetical protein